MIFDVLSVDGKSVVPQRCSQPERILEELRLEALRERTPDVFADGEALWEAVCAHEPEGVVAKKRSGRYLPGGHGWVKTKNRAYWRYEMEREGASSRRRERQFV
jgi:ATP-dependent DNA ligase